MGWKTERRAGRDRREPQWTPHDLRSVRGSDPDSRRWLRTVTRGSTRDYDADINRIRQRARSELRLGVDTRRSARSRGESRRRNSRRRGTSIIWIAFQAGGSRRGLFQFVVTSVFGSSGLRRGSLRAGSGLRRFSDRHARTRASRLTSAARARSASS